MDPEGRIELVLGTLSAGQGHETSFAQLLAEWLGVELAQVRLVTGDTDVIVVGGGSHSGRSMRLGAVVMAEASTRSSPGARGSPPGCSRPPRPTSSSRRGRFRVKGTDRAVDLFEAAAAALRPTRPRPARAAARASPTRP